MSQLTGKIVISPAKFRQFQKEIKNINELQKKIEGALDKKITEFLEIVLGGGICLNASDIHFEPEEKQMKIRFRIDGVLQNITDIKIDLYKNLLSRIKLVSGIKLNITKKPQDGRFTILAAAQTIEIRASALPTEYGETIVLRILNPKKLITMKELGLRKDLFEIFQKQIQRPNGMIIVTGPTGSGKSTTLYGFLKEILNPGIKIITIENPIEYHLKGISQTQIAPKKGYTFANGLKSIMRQDPDVILVGEIRDSETCKISIQAALTGHLVLTSLHTNDAAGTVARLISLQAKPCNIGPAINIAVAQRLVRKVCKKCSILKPASSLELKKIKQGMKNVPPKIKALVLKKGAKIKIAGIKGCADCNFTGYRGRVGIFEAFIMDQEIEKFILKNPSIAELRKFAVKKGMLPMVQDGLLKVLEATTTIEEVERVAGPITASE
jgi:type II secretory ATPase GspE/PulE/Tfp pilus assembly ATPase PilB-like protein